ncbi:hypothetical protein HHK36_006485 [Tetracentron sinense]|uniref:Uncharacterized protein n=1 Tax=Tetracentron sinense TaxID=13715 RepID=A0A835DP67_TETSI|nr:hypothetical protein HHK36_006485 [Tetracentron sinense]
MSAKIFPFPTLKNLKISASNNRFFFGNFSCIFQFPAKISPSPAKYSSKFDFSLRSNRFPDTHRRASTFENGRNSDEESIMEAREAISEIIQEAGVSKEESMNIALNSPKYVKLLIDSVRDLDELSLWNSWRSENEDVDTLSFKKKVFFMAKEKGDKGMLPFLESVGLNPSSSTHIARYLSSEKLPNLIDKVKYVKEMIFSGSDDEGFIAKNARRMMMHLSIFIDEDVQQTLSFFEKMEARRGGLNMLGSHDASFRYLVESFPRILLLSLESHMKPLLEFLEDIGVPKGRLRVILLLFPPLIFYDVEKDIKPRIRAFEKVGAEDKEIGRMLLKYPWILSASIQENYEEILSFFDMEKVHQSYQLIASHKVIAFGASPASWFVFRNIVSGNYRLTPIGNICLLSSATSSWILDSGAFDHMTGNLSLLSNVLCPSPFVTIANGTKTRVQGIRFKDEEDDWYMFVVPRLQLRSHFLLMLPYRHSISLETIKTDNFSPQVPKVSIDRAIKSWPHLLGCSTSKLKLMVEQFGELGVRNKKLGQVIASSPQLLLRKPQEFLQVGDSLFSP